MQLYKIIYAKFSIERDHVQTDDIKIVEEIVKGEEKRNQRLQQLVDEGKSPVFRKVDCYGNIIE